MNALATSLRLLSFRKLLTSPLRAAPSLGRSAPPASARHALADMATRAYSIGDVIVDEWG
jgi:hypothetical protein